MNKIKAIRTLGVFILHNKKDVITLINRLGLASLPYDVSMPILNEVVLDNLYNPLFVEKLNRVSEDDYEYIACGGVCIGIVVGIIVASTTTGIVLANKRAKRERDEVFRDNLRSRYLTQEQLKEIAYNEMRIMQREMLLSQAEYLQKEENLIQAQREDVRKNTLYIVIGGILTVAAGAILMKKYE